MLCKKSVVWLHRHRRAFAFFGAVCCLMSVFCASAFASGATTNSVDQVLDVVDKFTTKAIGQNGIGSQVITFVTSNPICMIGIAAFILVMLVGLVRRFITGV